MCVLLHHRLSCHVACIYITRSMMPHQHKTSTHCWIKYDTTRHDTIRYDTIRYDAIRYDTIRYVTIDTIRYDTIRYDKKRYDTIRYDTIRYDTIRYDTIRYDTIRYDTIRYDTIRYEALAQYWSNIYNAGPALKQQWVNISVLMLTGIRYDTIRYNTIRYDTIRYDTIRYDTIRWGWKIYKSYTAFKTIVQRHSKLFERNYAFREENRLYTGIVRESSQSF